jgi:flagellar hook assembly protein FlgD
MADVTLAVYSIDGRLVRRLAQGTSAAGYHLATWSGLDDLGRTVGNGVYICRLLVNREGATAGFSRKLVLKR